MKFLIINGPNLNLLGKREPGIYGDQTYDALCALIREHAEKNASTADFFQSNHEGDIIDAIHAADGVYDAIVINPAAYTHYSYAILDALKAVSVPAYEVHISHIDQRESFRAVSVTAPACVGQLYGHGFQGYLMAMDWFLEGGK
jgi:3-dehydroquinate dehydratase-2